jgi:two-component system, NtrC family, sensor kinase
MQTAQENLILIVDDLPTNLKVLFDLLSESGFQIIVARSGEDALEKIKQVLPELILLDVMMPGMDGFETCERLKTSELTQAIPVIFMTALSDTVDKVRGLSLGAVDYITKPFQHEEVLARVNVQLELYRSRSRLVQETKMAALGMLMAGVAHEINNPVAFITGNIAHAKTYHHDLLHLVELYEAAYPQPTPEIQAWSNKIDLPFLKQDLRQLTDSLQVGANRITEIVRSLRLFSRADDAERKVVNLHEGIDSSLMLLKHRLILGNGLPAVQVVKQYGEIPPLECYSGQLNQVFLNLLANGIDAIAERFTTFSSSTQQIEPQLQIASELHQNQILVRIRDNGMGMTDNTKQQVFKQFFTTKPGDKGTGLGLSICRKIVEENHQGKLSFTSQHGEGTTFEIWLPV